MIYKADARFKIREEDHNGQKQFSVWFEDRKLIAFETRPYPDYQNGRAKANTFKINCCVHDYGNNKKMQAMSGERLEELFREIDDEQHDFWQHVDALGIYLADAQEMLDTYGVKMEGYDETKAFLNELNGED